MQFDDRDIRGLCGCEERGVVTLNPPNGLAIVVVCLFLFVMKIRCNEWW